MMAGKNKKLINGSIKQFAGSFIMMLLLISCGDNQPVNYPTDTTKSGTINISVDESFKPIIDEQVKVFESSYRDAKIIVHYKPEAECMKDLMKDSTRMIIVTRELNQKEQNFL